MLSEQSSPAGLFTQTSQIVPALTIGRDDSFNSITGLNGSGKSNILDAICFVLGITNLGVVRAQNLQVRGRNRKVRILQALTRPLGPHLQARSSRCHES
jgi:DNA repair ATPase RecN